MKKNNRQRTVIFFLVVTASILSSARGQEDKKKIAELIIYETNLLRLEKKLPKLKPLDTLMGIAQYHSDNMVRHNFYSHIDHQGLNPIERAERQKIKAWVRRGNNFFGIAENIAKTPWFSNVLGCGDTRSPETFSKCVVKSWKESPPHYENILGDYTHIGVGIAFDEKKQGFSTQNFR